MPRLPSSVSSSTLTSCHVHRHLCTFSSCAYGFIDHKILRLTVSYFRQSRNISVTFILFLHRPFFPRCLFFFSAVQHKHICATDKLQKETQTKTIKDDKEKGKEDFGKVLICIFFLDGLFTIVPCVGLERGRAQEASRKFLQVSRNGSCH